jgi:hypothetical protein
MRKDVFGAALALAALAACGGGGGGSGSALSLPAGQPASSLDKDTGELRALDIDSPPQGIAAVQTDSQGGIAILGTQAVESLSDRAGLGLTGPGTVSARLGLGGAGTNPTRYLLSSDAPDTFNTDVIFDLLTQSEQAADGVMVRLNDTTLTGDRAALNIGGNANFAIGRWVTGTVTGGSGRNDVLMGDYKRAYHYLAFNETPFLPGKGTPPLTCDSGAFTTPTYLDSGPRDSPISGTATGSATINFEDSGALVIGAINVKAGNGAGTVRLNTTFNSPSSNILHVINTDNTTGNWTVAYMLGAGESYRTPMIAVRYVAVMLPSRARYIGVAKLTCRPAP